MIGDEVTLDGQLKEETKAQVKRPGSNLLGHRHGIYVANSKRKPVKKVSSFKETYHGCDVEIRQPCTRVEFINRAALFDEFKSKPRAQGRADERKVGRV